MRPARRSSRPSPRVVLALACLLASVAWSDVHGMIDSDQRIDCSSDDGFYPTYAFEFAKGGTFTLNLTLLDGGWRANNNTVQILLATEAQLDPIRSASMDDVCASTIFNYAPTLWQVQLGSGAATSAAFTRLTIPVNDWVRLLVLNCDGDEFHLVYSDVAMNPGGEYLSMSEVPYKKLYYSFLWVWSACALLWLVHVGAFCQWNVGLQTALALLPLTKVGVCLPALLYWQAASHTGVYPSQLGLLRDGCGVVDRVVTFVLLYVCATGWRILKPTMSARETRLLLMIALALTVSQTVYVLYGGFFIFLVLLAYLLALRVVFASVVEHSNLLLRQMHILVRCDVDHSRTPLQAKLGQFRYLQVYLVAYLSVDVIFSLWAAIFLRSQPWMSDMMEMAISVLLCACLAASFAMRPFNPFYRPIIETMIKYHELAPPPEDDEDAWARLAAPEPSQREDDDLHDDDDDREEALDSSEGQPPRHAQPGSGGSLNRSAANRSSAAENLDAPLVPRRDTSSSSQERARSSSRRRHGVQRNAAVAAATVERERLWYPCMRVPDLDARPTDVEGADDHGGRSAAAAAPQLQVDWSSSSRSLASSSSRRAPRPLDRESLLLVDSPFTSVDQPVMLGRLLPRPPSTQERQRKAAAVLAAATTGDPLSVDGRRADPSYVGEFASIPRAAYPYLPIVMRRAIRARQQQQQQRAADIEARSAPRRGRSDRPRVSARRHQDDYI